MATNWLDRVRQRIIGTTNGKNGARGKTISGQKTKSFVNIKIGTREKWNYFLADPLRRCPKWKHRRKVKEVALRLACYSCFDSNWDFHRTNRSYNSAPPWASVKQLVIRIRNDVPEYRVARNANQGYRNGITHFSAAQCPSSRRLFQLIAEYLLACLWLA